MFEANIFRKISFFRKFFRLLLLLASVHRRYICKSKNADYFAIASSAPPESVPIHHLHRQITSISAGLSFINRFKKVQKKITPTMDHIDFNSLPIHDNDEQPFQHNIDDIKVSTLESTIHTKYMMSNMHNIDLNSSPLPDNENSSPLPDNDEPQFEDQFNYMQGASTSKAKNKGANIMEEFDLNTTPITNNDKQPLESCFKNLQQKPISHIPHTKKLTHIMHHIDLNASSLPNEDEQSLEDYVDYMQGESMSFMTSGEAQHNVHSMNQGANNMDDFESMFFTNGSSSGKAQQKAHYNNQGVMHNFDLNEIPPFNDNEQSLIEELHEKAQDKDVMHFANMDIDASPILRNDEQPTNSSISVKQSSSSAQIFHKSSLGYGGNHCRNMIKWMCFYVSDINLKTQCLSDVEEQQQLN